MDSFAGRLLIGDCRERLRDLPDASIDAVVTDPPYELGFMGKAWDGAGVAYDVALWTEVLRVLKPGGHLLAFGGTRTYHRMACAIEDAGFEVRDSIHWLYGSGFPKSLDASKAIDKAAHAERKVVGTRKKLESYGKGNAVFGGGPDHGGEQSITTPATDAAKNWEGWGTALKPAHEPIVVARKPLVGTVAANVLQHGTGALNIDGCRVANTGAPIARVTGKGTLGGTSDGYDRPWKNDPEAVAARQNRADIAIEKANTIGRWPANLVLTHAADCADVCADGCPVAELDGQSGVSSSPSGPVKGQRRSGGILGAPAGNKVSNSGHGDSGGASRFFTVTEWDEVPFRYVAKPGKKERDAGGANAHPTVKPVELMRWLVRLVTPPGGIVLDPFLGSGTTAIAALLEGFDWRGIEMTAEYLPIIKGRVGSFEGATRARSPVGPATQEPLQLQFI